MQEEWWFGGFQQKEVPSERHCLVGVWVKSERCDVVVKVRGQLEGMRYFHRRRETLEPRKHTISKSKESSRAKDSRELAKGNRKVGRQETKKQGTVSMVRSSPSWLRDMLQRSAGGDRFVPTYLPKQKAKGHRWECMLDLQAPGTIRGDFLQKPWDPPSLPNIRYLRNSLVHILHLWMNHKPRDLSPVPLLGSPLLVNFH